MNILNKGFFLFDKGYPIHTWYPIVSGEKTELDVISALDKLDTSPIKKRGLYFHIPFCEDHVCSFCSFPRKVYDDSKEVDRYIEALIKEIRMKSQLDSIKNIPIYSIFIGGGTPSILSSEQILRLGKEIIKSFNLKNLVEYSFEGNIHSFTEEKLQALKEIGVTRIYTGIQSMNEKYRKKFDLLATKQEVYKKIKLLNKYFDEVSIDMIYGINGQTIEELVQDIHEACSLGVKLIDFYPLSQPKANCKLMNIFNKEKAAPKRELEILAYSILIKNISKMYGYYPHNQHGFVKVEDEIMDKEEKAKEFVFNYQESGMGDSDGDVIGFGVAANTMSVNYFMVNTHNVNDYIELMENSKVCSDVYKIDERLHYSKAFTGKLSYFGYVYKNKIEQDKVHPDTLKALNELIDNNIILEDDEKYYFSDYAWYWTTMIMYYLTPNCDKVVLDSIVNELNQFYLAEFPIGIR